MTSLISTLSLLILVLANGYFTFPIINEQISNSTFSPSNDDLTTEHAFSLRLVSDDETTETPNVEVKQPNEHIEFETTTHVDHPSEEYTSQPTRIFNELFTTEESHTEESHTDKQDLTDVSFTTVEPIIETTTFKVENDKREMKVELTTNDMTTFTSTLPTFTTTLPTFTSTLSSVPSELYTPESSTLTSTKKYTGLLQDEKEVEKEKSRNTQRKGNRKSKDKSSEESTKKSKVQSKDKSDEDSKESTAPKAVFDQQALKDVPYIPNGVMSLDENNDLVVTGIPNKFSTTTMENTKEQKILNQGKESSHIEEKKSNN